jgi:hypothetical protein
MHDEVLSIPLNPILSGEQVDFIITALNGFDLQTLKKNIPITAI